MPSYAKLYASTKILKERSLASLAARESDTATAAGVLALELSEMLDRDFELPPQILPDLARADAHVAALILRSEWNLGIDPIESLLHQVESRGVRVFSLGAVDRSVSGMSLWHQNVPIVFLNTASSGERGRFDLAHELAHILLHRHPGSVGREAEQEADRFVAELLVPSDALLSHPPRLITCDSVIARARHWGVSAMMIVRRLSDVHLLREWESRNLYRQLTARGFRSTEPGGIPRETSQLLAKVFDAYRGERRSMTDVARDLGWYASDLRELVRGLVPMMLDTSVVSKRITAPKPIDDRVAASDLRLMS